MIEKKGNYLEETISRNTDSNDSASENSEGSEKHDKESLYQLKVY